MKKSFVLLIALVLLAVTIVYYGQTSVMAEADQVQITEQVLYGDKSVVEGVTLQMKNHYQYQMFWDTTYVLGEQPEALTDYTFYQERNYSYSYWYYGTVNFEDESIRVFDWTEDIAEEQLIGIELAAFELYETAEPGERSEQLFYLKDYMEYYPFSVFISGDFDTQKDIEQLYVDMSEPELKSELLYAKGTELEMVEKKQKWLETFQEFFQIPIIDTEACVIAMEKDEDGQLTGWGVSTTGGGSGTGNMEIPEMPNYEDYDSFPFYTYSTVSDGDAYFTFGTRSYQDVVVDTSQIPGGYGIYHFPYDAEKNEIYPEKLKMVYALDPNVRVYDLTRDARGEHLLLFTEEDNGIYMSVIDIGTMTLENKLIVSDLGEDDTFYGIKHYSLFEDYMVVVTYGEIVVLSIDETGIYKKELTVEEEVFNQFSIDENGDTLIAGADTAYDWDGERLLFSNYIYNVNGYNGSNFYVAVIDNSGILYFAVYNTSLQTTVSYDSQGYPNYNYPHCCPVEDNAITISWK